MKVLIAAGLFLSSITFAACPQKDEKCVLAEQLVARLGYASSADMLLLKCYEDAKNYSPDVMVKKASDIYMGLMPDSPKWPKVLAAFERYKAESCSTSLRDLYLEAYRDAWSSTMSARQLDTSLKFLNSTEGQLFATAFPVVYKQVADRVSAQFGKHVSNHASLTRFCHVAEIRYAAQRPAASAGLRQLRLVCPR